MLDAVIIGGGITGLTCCYQLLRRGLAVRLAEAERPGGLIRTEKAGGFTLECGPNVVINKPALLNLLGDLGLASQIVYPRYRFFRQHVWHEGRIERVPKDPLTLIATPLLASEYKRRLPGRILFGAAPSLPDEDGSIAELFSPLVGEKGVASLLAPAIKGIYGGSVYHLSARSTFPKLWEMGKQRLSFRAYLKQKRRDQGGRSRVFTLRRGLSSLPEALLKRCAESNALLHGKVTAVERSEEGFLVSGEGWQPVAAKRVFVASSGPESASYLGGLTPAAVQALSAVSYVPLAVVHVAVPAEVSLPHKSFGVLFPSDPHRNILGVMFNSLLFPHVAPQGEHLLTVMLGGSDRRDIMGVCDQELLGLVAADLAKTLGIQHARVLWVSRWEQAIPSYTIGHHRLVERLRAAEAEHPGLKFVGVDLGLPGIADRVAMAIEACRA